MFLLIETIVGIVVSLGLLCSLNGKITGDVFNLRNVFSFFYETYSNSQRFITLFIVVSIVVLIEIVKKKEKQKGTVFFASFFSFCQLIGICFTKSGSFNFAFSNIWYLVRAINILISYFVVSYCFILLFFDWLKKNNVINNTNSMNSKKLFLFSFIFMIVFWLPYYFMLFPGTASQDTIRQVMMFFHYKNDKINWFLNLSPIRGENIYISNHHPFFTTIVYGFFSKIGLLLFGSVKIGLGLLSFVQIMIFASLYSCFVVLLNKVGVKEKIIKMSVIVFSIFPLFPLYATCLISDTLYAMAYLAFCLNLIEILRNHNNIKKIHFVLYDILFILISLTKNQGKYLAFIVSIALIIYFRKSLYRKELIINVVISTLVVFIWFSLVIPLCNVSPGGKQEYLGVFFQQTARYVKNYNDDISIEEKKVIGKILDYEKLASLYNPESQDSVKFTFNQDATNQQLEAYFKVWFKQFLKHPGCYVESVINNCYGYFNINRNSSLTYRNFGNLTEEGNKFYIEMSHMTENRQEMMQNIILFMQRIPILNIFLSISSYTLFTLLLITYQIVNRKKESFIISLFSFLSIIILFISPINANYRYSMPMFYLFPIVLLSTIIEYKKI